MKQIITVHGIRTEETWGTQLENLIPKNRTDVKFSHFEYGYLSVSKFTIGRIRAKVIKKFQAFYDENFDPENPPSIVCHSFGSLIFFDSIKSYSSIKFDKVILCGSILNTKINWEPYFERGQINSLYNDFGSRDDIVKFSWLLEGDCGKSGKVGFSKIPTGFEKKFKQANNFLQHGGYFFNTHMKAYWLPFLLPKAVKYDDTFITEQLISRVYTNFEPEPIACSRVEYSARIDEKGNYHAHYSKEGINSSSTPLNGLTINTMSDSMDTAEEMGFRAYDKNGVLLATNWEIDEDQKKRFVIGFETPVQKDEKFYCRYLFRWRNTITFNRGDFDHFSIKNAEKVSININVKFNLVNPKFFVLNEGRIVEELKFGKIDERDGTKSYNLEYENIANCDGVIFYFERTHIPKVTPNVKEIKGFKKIDNDIKIFRCSADDVSQVHRLEIAIETGSPATENILRDRWELFSEGFLVAKDKRNVVGYVETVIWQDIEFETFDEIKDFSQLFNVQGDTLYIIYIAVKEEFRGLHIGERLMELAERKATKPVKKIKLVSRESLVTYYEDLNFIQMRELPNFLPALGERCFLMQKDLNLEQ